MDKNAALYYQSACALKLPVTLIPQIAGFEVKLGRQRYFFRGGETPFNLGSSTGIAKNKCCMNKLLEASGFPVPRASVCDRDSFAELPIDTIIYGLNFPLVAKPMEGGCGVDVLCNINSKEQLISHIKTCFQRHDYVSIEAFHGGLNSYRVMVFYNKVIGVVQRLPARVIGDGIHSIRELIDITNIAREKWKDKVTLGPIKIDEECLIRLNELGMTPDTIPDTQQEVVLCYTCNSSRGGVMKSLGKMICPENARLLIRAAQVMGLNFVGFDVQCEDILTPIEKSRGVIIEANNNPDITIHECAILGAPNRVSKTIMRRLVLRHPVAWALGLYKTRRGGFYIKSLLVAGGFFLWKTMA